MTELLVRDLMSTDLVTLERGQSLSVAKELMQLRRVRHLPVVDGDGRLVGLVSHRDLLAAMVSTMSPLDDRGRATYEGLIDVGEIMRTTVTTVTPETPAVTAARTLRERGIGCLPVVSGDTLAGILTEADLLALVETALEPPPPREPRVDEVMARSPITAAPDTSVADARALMRQHRIRHLPVLLDGEILGLVTSRELATAVTAGRDAAERCAVGTLLGHPPLVVDAEARLGATILDIADDERGAALVTRGGELVGVLTTTDVARMLAARLPH